MCGIVGVATSKLLTKELVSTFQEMLYVDAMRGPHSTGVLSYHNNGKAQVYKRALCAADFLNLKAVDSMLAKAVYGKHLLLGHNRWATKGEINDDNAHPFEMGSIIGVHNGSLNRWAHHAKGYDVDSAALYDALSRAANSKEVIEVLEEIDGAFALVWVDTATGTLHMTRNKERPLWTHKTNDGILWASEPWMLNMGVDRGRVPAFKGDERLWHPESLPINLYRVYDIATMKIIEEKEVTPYEKKPIAHTPTVITGPTGNTGTSVRDVRLRDTPQVGEKLLVEFGGDDYVANNVSAYGKALSFISTSEFFVDVELTALTQGQFTAGVWELTVFRKEFDAYRALNPDESGVKLVCRAVDAKFLGAKDELLDKHEDDGVMDMLGYWVKKSEAEGSTDKPKQDASKGGGAQYYTGYNGVMLTVTAFNSLTSKGCYNCGCVLTPNTVYWRNYSTPICLECATNTADYM